MNKEFEQLIERINNNYNFRVNIYPDTIFVNSRNGEWYTENVANGKILLKHRGYKKYIEQFHEQRKLTNYNQVFDLIYQHDNYILNGSAIPM